MQLFVPNRKNIFWCESDCLILGALYKTFYTFYISSPKKFHNSTREMLASHHHHQPINVPTARAQVFLIYHTKGMGHTHHASPVRTGAIDCKCSQDQRLNVPSKARRSSTKLIFGHPSDDPPMLLRFRYRTPSAPTAWPSSSSVKSQT
jgi:hypothetical protein